MKFSRLFPAKNVINRLQSSKKEKALKEILEILVKRDILAKEHVRAAYRAVRKREKLGSTGIGKGIAIPHAKLKTIDNIIAALARSNEGVEFDSVDGEKVFLIFFILSPPKEEKMHLDLLRWISDIARNNDFRRFLKEAKFQKEIAGILKEADEAAGR